MIAVADAAFLIALLDPHDAHHSAATTISSQFDALRMHPLNMAEVLVSLAPGERNKAVETWRAEGVSPVTLFLDIPDTDTRERHHMLALADMRATYRIKMPDACALLAARTLQVPLLTFDEPLRKAARRARIDAPGTIS